jgi:rubrerythrin
VSKYFLLKFNHGVEIGANLAYLGHYRRTQDQKVFDIAIEEFQHRETLKMVLQTYGLKPSLIWNGIFQGIGTSIFWLCQISPIWSLDLVARLMEKFAIFNYKALADLFPEHRDLFLKMSKAEEEHEAYFSGH